MTISATPHWVRTPPGMRSASTDRCASTTCAARPTPRTRRNGGPRLAGPSSAPTPARSDARAEVPFQRVARRAAELIRRLKSVITMCYYELPEVQREIGYDPAPYIAAGSRRRLESYGPDIRAGEAAVTSAPERGAPERDTP